MIQSDEPVLESLAVARQVGGSESGWTDELSKRASFFLRDEFTADALSPDAAERSSASPDSQARQDAADVAASTASDDRGRIG